MNYFVNNWVVWCPRDAKLGIEQVVSSAGSVEVENPSFVWCTRARDSRPIRRDSHGLVPLGIHSFSL